MKIETILNAYMKTSNLWKPERARQRAAFRARILRTDAELREGLTIANQVVADQAIRIAKKSCQIAELEGYNADQNTIIVRQHKRIAELEDEVWHWEHGG